MRETASEHEPNLERLAALHPAERADLLRADPDPDDRIATLIREVQALALQDPPAALDASEWLVDLADACASPLTRTLARCAHSYTLGVANHFERSLAVLADARAIADDADDTLASAHVEHNAVQPLARLGRHSEAVRRASDAVRLFDLAGDPRAAARARCNLGLVHRMRDDPERALEQYDAALESLADEPMLAAQIQSNRAEALLDRADFNAAESAFRAALDAFTHANAGHAAAFVEGNLADLLGRQGRMHGALRHFQLAIERLDAAGVHGDAARLEAERAEVLASVGLLDDAANAFDDAIAALDDAGLVRESARARLGLARTLARLARTRRADRALQEAADRFARIESTLGVARVNVARAWLIMHDHPTQAESLLRDALDSLRDDPVDRAGALLALANILLAESRPDEALTHVDLATDIAENLELRPLLAELLHARARALLAQGHTRRALQALSHGVEQVERLRGLLAVDRQRAAWTGQRSDIYQCLAQAALDLGSHDATRAAFRAVEQSKARSLLDIVRGGIELAEHLRSGAEELAEGRHLARLARARADLNALYSWRTADSDRADHLPRAEWRRRVEALEREIASIEGRMASTRRYAAIFAQPTELEEVQALLLQSTRIVEYFRIGDDIGAFVIGPDSVDVVRNLCNAAHLADAARRVTFQIRRGVTQSPRRLDGKPTDHARRELNRLHRLILHPLSHLLNDAGRIVFIPHADLHGLPLHALHDADTYLIQRCDVTYAPSASLLATISTTAGARSTGDHAPPLVIGVADETAPHIRDEALEVAAAAPDATCLLDENATVQRFEELARNARFLHVACHGEFPPSTPMSARLRLGDRWLTAREIFAMTVTGPVVLSCCDVGRSAVMRADEIFGMVRAFLAAGAPAIVTGLWPAHDAATRQLMRHVYTLTPERGESIRNSGLSTALCEAQRRLIRDRPHPASWATMLCVGGL